MAARLGAFLAFVLVLSMLLQSSAAAPAEEAAKALRVKRCHFSVYYCCFRSPLFSGRMVEKSVFFCLYFSLFLCFLLFLVEFLSVSYCFRSPLFSGRMAEKS